MVALERCARESSVVLQNMFQLYAYDFSEHMDVPLRADGRFEASISDVWWTDEQHHPFIVRDTGALSGFALARRGSRVTADAAPMDVAEFFILRGARRRGLGTAAAHALFQTFRGPWEARVRMSNAPAARFWADAMSTFGGTKVTGEAFSTNDVAWQVFRVTS